MFLTGWVLTGFVGLFLLIDGGARLAGFAPYVDGMTKFGYSASLAPSIGFVLLVCTITMLNPRTAVLGCILVTGYLGGAVATQVRVNDAWFMFPGALGVHGMARALSSRRATAFAAPAGVGRSRMPAGRACEPAPRLRRGLATARP